MLAKKGNLPDKGHASRECNSTHPGCSAPALVFHDSGLMTASPLEWTDAVTTIDPVDIATGSTEARQNQGPPRPTLHTPHISYLSKELSLGFETPSQQLADD